MDTIIVTTPKELTAIVESAVEKALSQRAKAIEPEKTESDVFIRGINGLAEFLHVSTPTAQKMKNNKLFPCYQDGRVCVFKANEVLKAMRAK